ncbi:hypothetical protein HUJ04_010727 [Dendroctonus ponderosae]|nr:hypothetical protein HUJ04_010727 [Dendroctonus ponderosae]
MKFIAGVFDGNFKIAFYLFFEPFMKLLSIMDLLKIFRMQEPVPKDLLPKKPEVGKYQKVVQEKDVLLRNSKARILELEEQVADLDTKYRKLQEIQTYPQCEKKIIEQYETFYLKIMCESQQIVDQKKRAEAKLEEMQIFCADLLEKYEKAKSVIGQYDEVHTKLKNQLMEYEVVIARQC